MLDIEGLEPGMKVRILAPYFRLRIETTQSQISTEFIEDGIYFLQIYHPDGWLLFNSKIMIKH